LSSSKSTIDEFLEWFGDLGIFFWHVVRAAVTPPFEFRELFRQLDEIGSKSLPLVALAGGATGVVLSLEARYSLTRFGAKSLLPAAIVFSVIHETGPIITGLVVSGRVGAGIGAELVEGQTGDVLTVDANRSRVGLLQSNDESQQYALAGPASPKDCQSLAAVHSEADPV
jgi:ABC-type transporter Mla maintaining outer membrane lipid asymmetry permease subunit MlaE